MLSRRNLLLSSGCAALASIVPTAVFARDPVTIEIFHAMPGQDAYFNQVAQAFMKAHPDIQVKFRASSTNYPEAHQAILRGVLTNKLPDVYHSAWIYFREAVLQLNKRHAIVDISDFVAKEGKAWQDANYYPNMLKAGQVNGRQYALPFAASTPVVFYNADLVKAAGGDPDNLPTDWDALIALGGKIKKLGNGVDGLTFDVHCWPDDWLWQSAILEQGGSMMAPDGKHCGFDNAYGLNALKRFVRIMKEGGMTMRDYEQSRQQFVAGKIGILFSSPNAARAFTDLVGKRFTLGCQIYPLADKEKGTIPMGGNGAVILAKDPAKQRAAWEWLKFACGPEGQKIAVLGSGYIPTNRMAEEPQYLGEFYKKNPLWYTPVKQIQHAVSWQGYSGQNGVKIWYAQRDLIGLVMRGELSPEEGLRKIVAVTNSLI